MQIPSYTEDIMKDTNFKGYLQGSEWDSLIKRVEICRHPVLLYLSSRSVGWDGTVLYTSLYPAVLRKPQTLLVYGTSLLLFPLKLGHFSCSVSSNHLK